MNLTLRYAMRPARSFALAMVAAASCTQRQPGGETEGSTTGDGTTGGSSITGTTGSMPTSGEPPTTGGPTDPQGVWIPARAEIDLLFVIDNSASMGPTQARLSQGLAALLAPLEQSGAHVRIGFTTTDSGNPRCPAATTTPEGGKLVLSSCIDRVQQGEFMIEAIGEDVSWVCNDFCGLADAALPITPTTTHVSDGQAAPRRWLEFRSSQANVPDGVDLLEALRCFAPQGVTGCGLESHLESMYLALAQASRADSPTNFGFLRDASILGVVIVSDETDCSYAPEFDEIFTTNKVFWDDPQAPSPTSAVCWNAGVACEGAGPTYASCVATNFDASGTPGVADDQAVLRPIAKYINFVQEIEDHKRLFDPAMEVKVALLTGVPEGYESGATEIIYEDTFDPEYQSDFGIGPGCVGGDGRRAVPPVREREFAEAFQVGPDRNLHSICADSYADALERIAEGLVDQIRPACMTQCVKDIDPMTPILDPECQVFEVNPAAMTRTEVHHCDEVGGAWQVPPGETVCFAERVDQGGQTPSGIDDMSPACLAEGYNLEFVIIRSAQPPEGIMLEAVCAPSLNPAKDCPAL